MNKVESLMWEYFNLKDEFKALGVARNEYMENYQCQNIKSDGYMEPAGTCFERRRWHGVPTEGIAA